MGKYIGQEVFIVHGHMKSYRGTLQSLSETKCVVAVLQGSRHEFKRNEVAVSVIINFSHLDTHAHLDGLEGY